MAEEINQQPQGVYTLPSQVNQDLYEQGIQIVRVLTEHDNFLSVIRSELRGEQLYVNEEGEKYWVQVDKPTFIKLNRDNSPVKVFNKKTKREEYICNDDAINEVLSCLKSCGLNPITPLTNISEIEIIADLLEMECKIAMLLAVNRKKWGIEKASYPMIVGKLKVLIKDARYRAKDGTVLRALRTMTTRMEQSSESVPKKTMGERITSPFS